VIAIPNIRLAHPCDALAIAEMSRDYIEYGLGWGWTPARVLRAIHDKSTNVAVIHARGGIPGFGIMEYGEGTAHLVLLGVQPAHRKKGLGAGLVSWLEKPARTAGVERIFVEARSDNLAAIAFYRKLGFRELERITGYYRDIVDGVRLEKRLWSRPP
jgi:ribosomal protein S18 acetylase RimI-like enzyme